MIILSLIKEKKYFHIIGSIIITIIAIAIGCMIAVYSSRQTTRIRQMLNESAYMNVQNTLTNLENMISNEFEEDHRQLETIASGCSSVDNVENYIQNLKYSSDINGIYFGRKNDQKATGKDGMELDISKLEFQEHTNGVVRSESYMDNFGDFAYVVKEPVIKNGDTVGYLYAEYVLERFAKLMPRDEEIIGNNYSIMIADSMRYVYTPTSSRLDHILILSVFKIICKAKKMLILH